MHSDVLSLQHMDEGGVIRTLTMLYWLLIVNKLTQKSTAYIIHLQKLTNTNCTGGSNCIHSTTQDAILYPLCSYNNPPMCPIDQFNMGSTNPSANTGHLQCQLLRDGSHCGCELLSCVPSSWEGSGYTMSTCWMNTWVSATRATLWSAGLTMVGVLGGRNTL